MKKFVLKNILFLSALISLAGCEQKQIEVTDITPNKVVPTDNLMSYQKMELVGFIHFSINTFTDKEWGYGDESPTVFNPSELNVEQWVETAKAAGMQELILTAKHHDGFCLWQSKYTDYSIKNSPYKNGKGDIVDEFVKACKKHGLKAGLYLSPWDRNHKEYGKDGYIQYYKNQLTELLTKYVQINEIWFDGANGGNGYYGGAKETRKIDSKTYYPWKEIFALAKELQPDIKIFSDKGPDIHWIGNEKGFAGFTFWSTIDSDSITIGGSDMKYLNSGDEKGNDWIIGQCDVSIRPGWFYHKTQDSLVKSPQELVNIYYKSVGRNAVLLLNLPPDTRGLIHDNDIAALKEFKEIIDESFSKNLAKEAKIEANNYRKNNDKFAPKNAIDDNIASYWATCDSILPAQLTLKLPKEIAFDRILIQEPIKYGQRIRKFNIEILKDKNWKKVFEGTTIGYKRLIRIPKEITTQVRINVTQANNTVAISNIGLFKSSKREREN